MRKTWMIAAVALVAGCSSGSKRPELRRALDEAKLSLVDSIGVALTEAEGSKALKGALVNNTGELAFSVGRLNAEAYEDVRVDGITGRVLSRAQGLATDPCPSAIPLAEALAIAEREADGESVAAVPDDDVACAREIQVLSGDVLYEVKVAGDGAVLEQELSDELNGGDGD